MNDQLHKSTFHLGFKSKVLIALEAKIFLKFPEIHPDQPHHLLHLP